MPGKPEKYAANSPELLLPLVEKISKEIAECSNMIKKLIIAYESLKYVHPEWSVEKREYWVIKNGEEIYKIVKNLIDEALNSINILTKSDSIIRIYKKHYEELEKAVKRKVFIRLIVPSMPSNKAMINDFSKIASIKALEGIQFPFEYLCIDFKKMVFMKFYNKGISYDEKCIGLLIEDPLIVEAYKHLFDFYWNRCFELK